MSVQTPEPSAPPRPPSSAIPMAILVALLAVGAHVRRLGHNTISASIAPRTTLFVILMFTSVAVQVYVVPKSKTMNDILFLGVLAAAAGIAALLVAAGIFKRASEATSTMALPTATVLPPSGE